MRANAVNYMKSNDPLPDQIIPDNRPISVCPHISAGHPKHEYSTGSAWPLI